jgi:hypothetical protein
MKISEPSRGGLKVFRNNMAKKKPKQEIVLHELYNRAHPLLRELVTITVFGDDGRIFDVLLTRVPCVGEFISKEDYYYKITRVEHFPVDDDGRSFAGSHAIVVGEFTLDDYVTPRRRKKQPDTPSPPDL